MAFEHNPGLAALHAVIGAKPAAIAAEPTVEQEVEAKAELEAIVKELADDDKVNRPLWRGGFGN